MHPRGVTDASLPTVRVRRSSASTEIVSGAHPRPLPCDVVRSLRGPCVLMADDGAVAVIVRYPHDTGSLLSAVRSVPVKRVRRNGELVVATRVWGRFPTPRGSRETSLGAQCPSADAELRSYAHRLSSLFAELLPEEHGRAVSEVRSPIGPGVPWTTGSINSATATAYHRDTKNLRGTWSGMAVLRGPGVCGGELALPELGVALDLTDGDVLFFDGGALWHGNAPLSVPEASWRYSLPCYAMEL